MATIGLKGFAQSLTGSVGLLALGALEWVRTPVVLAGARIREGLQYGRLTAILGVVAAVYAASALAFRAAPVRRWFRSGAPAAE